MIKINGGFKRKEVTRLLLVLLFSIASTVLYVGRTYSLPPLFWGMLWLVVICAALAGGLLFWRASLERKEVVRLAKNSADANADREAVYGIIAVAVAGAFSPSLSVSVLVILYVVTSVYFRRTKRERRVDAGVITAAMIYTVTLALLVVYLRTACGFILPQEPLNPTLSGIPSAYYAVDPTLSVYDKTHIKSSVAQFFLFSGVFFLLLLPACAGNYTHRWIWLRNPVAAIAVLIALAATIPVPPFNMDGAHWAHWIGPSQALLDGDWPYYDVFSFYGFLPIMLLAGWQSIFGVSPISLAILLSLLAFLSAMFVYALIARHGRSRFAALIGVSILMLLAYNHEKWALPTPNHSALRFHFFISAVLWMAFELFVSLKRGGRNAYWYAFLIGVFTTWGPSDGVFLLFGITLVLIVATIKDPDLAIRRAVGVYATYIMGILMFPGIGAVVSRGGLHNAVDAYLSTVDFLSIFSQGYGGLPQYFDQSLLLMIVMVMVLTAYCIRFFVSHRASTPLFEFCLFSLVLSIPYLLQAVNRSPVLPNGFIWVILPCFLILAARLSKAVYRTAPSTAIGSGVFAMWMVLSMGNPVSLVAEKLRIVTVRLEPAIHSWSMSCAADQAAGLPCADKPVTLADLYANERGFSFENDPGFLRMAAECRAGTLIVDVLDAFVYMAGNCRPQHPYQSFFSISTKRQVEAYQQILSGGSPVFFGEASFVYQQRLLNYLKETWIARRRALSDCDAAQGETSQFVAGALSDKTRSRGIELSGNPSVILDTDRGVLCHIRPGMRLQFAGSGVRVVSEISGDTIRLTGAPLDPNTDGYPNPIRVVSETGR